MRLRPVGGYPLTLRCRRCTSEFDCSKEGTADLDAPPFQHYYCGACSKLLEQAPAAPRPQVGRAAQTTLW